MPAQLCHIWDSYDAENNSFVEIFENVENTDDQAADSKFVTPELQFSGDGSATASVVVPRRDINKE